MIIAILRAIHSSHRQIMIPRLGLRLLISRVLAVVAHRVVSLLYQSPSEVGVSSYDLVVMAEGELLEEVVVAMAALLEQSPEPTSS